MEAGEAREFWLGDSDGPMGDVGAFMASELRVDRADLAAYIRQIEAPRALIAVVGAPASGKSHLAAELAAELNAHAPGSAVVVAMDGFHLPNRVLAERGLLPRKGAPETFDIEGLSRSLGAIRAPGTAHLVPVFDRAADEPDPEGAAIPATARHLIVEGNYLLLTRPGWRDLFPLFDLTIRLAVPEATLRARLAARWADLPADEAARKIEENDLPNGRLLRAENRAADLVIAG